MSHLTDRKNFYPFYVLLGRGLCCVFMIKILQYSVHVARKKISYRGVTPQISMGCMTPVAPSVTKPLTCVGWGASQLSSPHENGHKNDPHCVKFENLHELFSTQ